MELQLDNGEYQVVFRDSNLNVALEESAPLNVVVGESARIEVGEAINYIQAGTQEIAEAVQEGIASFDSNAQEKTDEFNTNASEKLSEYNSNAAEKLSAYNANDVAKTQAYNSNAQEKLNAYNTNASEKLSEFNANYTEKKALIDAQVDIAEEQANIATSQAQTATVQASSATASANRASVSETNAKTSELSAYNSEQSASQSAAAAAGSATSASQSASSASSSASSAGSSATQAATSATNAASSASQAAQSAASIDADNIWNAIETLQDDVERIQLAKSPDLTIIGNVTIDSGNVSGFSAANYLQFPFVWNFNSYHWGLKLGFVTGTDVTNQQNILDSVYGVALAIHNGKFVLAISSNGTTWDIGNLTGTYDVQPNTSYSLKLEWDGTDYTLSYSLDETNYTTDITINSSTVHRATQEFVGASPNLWGADTAHPFAGTLNLNDWELTVNDLVVWTGMDDVGLGSRANVSLSNLDAVGEARFAAKQDTLVSGTNIKTINNNSILGSGNLTLDGLPSQTGQAGKFLTTDGSLASWAQVDITPDNLSITKDSNNHLQAIGVIDSNNTTNAIKTWTGTKAQYEAIASKDANTLYNITDDTDVSLTILEALYPVGSVYITTANTCPLSTLISGSTWELVSSGRVLQGADSGHSAGTIIEAGLPNIEGSTGGTSYANRVPVSGPFYLDTATTTQPSSGSTNPQNVHFDASRANPIYGNSTTVQPPAYVVNIYRRTA